MPHAFVISLPDYILCIPTLYTCGRKSPEKFPVFPEKIPELPEKHTFSEKSLENIWWFQIFFVTLHRQTEKVEIWSTKI